MNGRIVMTALLGLAMTAVADGQQLVRSVEDLPSVIRVEETVRIIGSDGRSVTGRFLGMSGGILRIRSEGMVLDLRNSTIQRVERRRPESKWNGFLIGLGAGAAAGLLGSSISCGSDQECAFYSSLVYTPVFAGVGAGAGTLIDFAIRKYDPVFQTSGTGRLRVQAAPLIARSSRGIILRLSF